jgi:hypothetical protein
MKLIIDLSDPSADAQLRAAIDAKVGELIAERINKLVDEIFSKKVERMTDDRIHAALKSVVADKTRDYFTKPWNGPSSFERDLAKELKVIVAEGLKKI